MAALPRPSKGHHLYLEECRNPEESCAPLTTSWKPLIAKSHMYIHMQGFIHRLLITMRIHIRSSLGRNTTRHSYSIHHRNDHHVVCSYSTVHSGMSIGFVVDCGAIHGDGREILMNSQKITLPWRINERFRLQQVVGSPLAAAAALTGPSRKLHVRNGVATVGVEQWCACA